MREACRQDLSHSMMGQREIDMKLLRAVAVGLLLAGTVSVAAQDFDKGRDAFKAGDYATALQELRPLAEQGNANAQKQLGIMYSLGSGVPRDYAEAAQWLRLAAEQGNAAAQFNLGLMYSLGRGVLQDDVITHMWWNIAGANGDGGGSSGRGIIEERMTREQIAEAQALARRCMASDYQDCG